MAGTIVNYEGKRQLTMASYEGKAELVNNLDYDIIDYPVDGITNEQMTFALTCKRLFPGGATFICKDNGTYKAGHTYQIKVSGDAKSWEDITDLTKYTAGSNITIGNDNTISATVPTKTSELTNDSGFINSTALNTELGKKQDKLSDAQLLAVNSGITDTKVAQIETNATNITSLQTGKQDKLTAGTGITIQDNIISARTSQPVYKHKLLINVTIGTYATTAIYNYLSNSSEAITDFTSVEDDFDIGASNASADNLVKVFGIRVTKVGNVVTVKGTDSTFAELTGSATLGNDSVSQLV